MRQLALAAVVALLSINVSGVVSLLVDEPCAPYEVAGEDEGGCAPTCVTCGCCAQSIEPAFLTAEMSPAPVAPDVAAAPTAVPTIDPRDILHVPKPQHS